MSDVRIPVEYKKFWVPFRTDQVLYHLTTKSNLKNIRAHGQMEPRDPSPKYWAGMKAIFLANPADPLYKKTLQNVLAHVKEKNKDLARLHIRTKNKLYRSIDPERTFQVISLDPISANEIEALEEIE